MHRTFWLSAIVMLLNLMHYIPGVMTQPQNVTLHIWEGNVTVTWDTPQENPVDCLYQIQISDFSETPNAWKNISECSLIKTTVCNVGMLSNEPRLHVRVGVLTSQGFFSWSKRKSINIRESHLYPPSFSLLYTYSSIQVKVQKKTLPRVFPYGLDYTAYLWLEGKESQTQSDDDPDDDGEMKFSLLRHWHTYCLRVQVKSTSTGASNSSTECVQLPPDMTLIICFVFLGLLGFVTFLMLFFCFLKRPRKMPDALQPVLNKWQPMIIGPVQVEMVTDKGWLLISSKNEEKWQISEEKAEFTEEEKDRRESLDSGVSMEQLDLSLSSPKTDGQTGDIQEDSGCESLKGTECSGTARQATDELLSLEELSHDSTNEGNEDSGLGLGEDSGLLSEVVVGDGYRSQSPSSVDVKNDSLEGCNMSTNMATPSGGYRPGQVICMCSDHEYCFWCKCKKPLTENCQSETPVQTKCETDDGSSAVSSYKTKNVIQTVNLLGMEDTQFILPQSDMSPETSPFLFSCPFHLQSVENQTFMIDMHSFTLDDVKLTF